MGKLLLIGASLLAFHGGHHHRYWWPAENVCVLTAGTDRHGVWHATPFIQCTARPAGFHNRPDPTPEQGIPVNSPQSTQTAQNYCPTKPGGWCQKPSGVANIGPGYAGH